MISNVNFYAESVFFIKFDEKEFFQELFAFFDNLFRFNRDSESEKYGKKMQKSQKIIFSRKNEKKFGFRNY